MELENGLPFKFYFENVDKFGRILPNNLSIDEISNYNSKCSDDYHWNHFEMERNTEKLLGTVYRGYVETSKLSTTDINNDDVLAYLCESYTPPVYYGDNFIKNISKEALLKLKEGKLIVIFNWFGEPLYDTTFNIFIENMCNENDIDISNFFILTSANNIKNTSKINYISDHFFLSNSAKSLKTFLKNKVVEGWEFEYQNEIVDYDVFNFKKTKHFLSLNRQVNRPHRYSLGLLLEKYNLWDLGYFTFLNLPEEQTQAIECMSQSDFDSYDDIHTKFTSKLPIEIDTIFLKDKSTMSSFPTSTTYFKKNYQDTIINIVTETTFTNNVVFISEKTFHPIINLQPFIILASNGQLAELKRLGFKTFSHIIDESYDDEEDSHKRFKKASDEILRLSKMSIDDMNELFLSCKDICIYNRNHLLSFTKYNVFENSLQKIKKIWNSKEKRF